MFRNMAVRWAADFLGKKGTFPEHAFFEASSIRKVDFMSFKLETME